MDRKEMLDKLHSIDSVKIGELIMTYDIGIQFSYATKNGYGYDGGFNVGEWPVMRVQDETLPDKWDSIVLKIKDGTLCYDDLKDTALEPIADRVEQGFTLLPCKDPESNKVNMAEYMQPLTAISREGSADFFLFLDLGQWDLDDLKVYATEEDAKLAFVEQYCSISEWEELNDEELLEWCDKLFSDDSDFGFVYRSRS